jgi:hypothetical protein
LCSASKFVVKSPACAYLQNVMGKLKKRHSRQTREPPKKNLMVTKRYFVKLKNKSGDQKPQKKRRVFRKALRVGTKFKFKKMKNVMNEM